ncbi:MAG: hypothetical protein ACLQAR_15595 [Steroidobacteraceae bacterium]
MRFHIDWGKTFQAMLAFQISPPAQRNIKSAIRQPETLAPRPMARRSPRLELPSQNAGIVEDSAMISALYEAHLSMEKMLAALAEFRGDDAEDALG